MLSTYVKISTDLPNYLEQEDLPWKKLPEFYFRYFRRPEIRG